MTVGIESALLTFDDYRCPVASMTKENGAPTTTEKDKGKATDGQATEFTTKGDNIKKDKDGKPMTNGKKGEELEEGQTLQRGK